MNNTRLPASRLLSAVLAAALMAPVPPALAEIVDTDAMTAQTQAELDRAKVRAFVERATVRERLEAMGVAGLAATDRVAALSEAEVHALAQRIDAMPAGGNLSNQDLVLILLVAILVAIAL